MPVLASALAAFIPMVLYMLLIWWYDRYDREPLGLVIKNFLWGAIGAVILAIIWSGLLSFMISFVIPDELSRSRVETIIIAPFVEEITKGIFLLITVFSRKFDNITDGIVYGGAIGLGFGMTENFFYFVGFGDTFQNWISIVIIRSLFSAVMHCVCTATFGAFIGYAKFKSIYYKLTFPFIGLGLAMFIHAAWNFSVSFNSTAILGFIFLFFTIIIFISFFSISVLQEKKVIYRELLEEVDSGLIPVDHITILNSGKRNKAGWVNEPVRKRYVKAATRLAFRKMQLKNSFGRNRIFYETEVNSYRTEIYNLLYSNNIIQNG
jgi:protease PrsW